MAAAKKKMLHCKRCNVEVFDTVITRHMWKAHYKHMMKNRGGRRKVVGTIVIPKRSPAEEFALAQHTLVRDQIKKQQSVPFADQLRATYVAPSGKTLTVVIHQGKNNIEIRNVTLVEVCE